MSQNRGSPDYSTCDKVGLVHLEADYVISGDRYQNIRLLLHNHPTSTSFRYFMLDTSNMFCSFGSLWDRKGFCPVLRAKLKLWTFFSTFVS